MLLTGGNSRVSPRSAADVSGSDVLPDNCHTPVGSFGSPGGGGGTDRSAAVETESGSEAEANRSGWPTR